MSINSLSSVPEMHWVRFVCRDELNVLQQHSLRSRCNILIQLFASTKRCFQSGLNRLNLSNTGHNIGWTANKSKQQLFINDTISMVKTAALISITLTVISIPAGNLDFFPLPAKLPTTVDFEPKLLQYWAFHSINLITVMKEKKDLINLNKSELYFSQKSQEHGILNSNAPINYSVQS